MVLKKLINMKALNYVIVSSLMLLTVTSFASADFLDSQTVSREGDGVWDFKRVVEVSAGYLDDYQGKIKCSFDISAASDISVNKYDSVRDLSLADFKSTSQAAAHLYNCYVNDVSVSAEKTGNKVSVKIDELNDSNNSAKQVTIKIESNDGQFYIFYGEGVTLSPLN